ncbi:MAG: DUF937 domain-containing protein [Candidatus Aminicenantes bacterium]|nr:DUF937 domain-containing protein [Candidatus Aminicenantes bacterium]
MANFIDEFMGTYGSKVSKDLSKTLGVKKGILKQIIPQIAPLILGGLKKQKDNHGGDARIDHILNKYGSSDVLNDLSGLFKSKAGDSNPDPGLGGLLGNSGLQASDALAKKFNIDSGTIMKLIPMLAPVVLGALTKKRDSGAGSGGIGALLDQDGDGSILDDVAGLLLGGGGRRKSGGLGGALSGLLGGLLGKKR